MAANPLSEYANSLDPHVKKRYYEKISCVVIDPILIPEKAYDPDCLPRVEIIDFRLSLTARRRRAVLAGGSVFFFFF